MLVIYFDRMESYLGSDPEFPQAFNPVTARKFTGAADAACVIATLPKWARAILQPKIFSFDPASGVTKEIDQ